MEDFRLIYQTYYPAVRPFFAGRGLSREDCLDLTQETFIRIYRGMETYRDEKNLRAWVFTIALNVYRHWLRRAGAAKRSANEVPYDDTADLSERAVTTPATQEQRLLYEERMDRVRLAIDKLTEKQRQCLTLYLDELSHDEIAEVMNLSVNTVKSHLFRARNHLKDILKDVDLEASANEVVA